MGDIPGHPRPETIHRLRDIHLLRDTHLPATIHRLRDTHLPATSRPTTVAAGSTTGLAAQVDQVDLVANLRLNLPRPASPGAKGPALTARAAVSAVSRRTSSAAF